MAGLSGHFFDTSVIVAGIIELGSDHAASQIVMDAIADGRFKGPMTAWHCCLEFYSVATRLPREFRITPDVALTLLEQEILARFHVHALPRNRRESFLRGLAHDAIAGGRIYELGGPEVRSFRALLEEMLRVIGRRRILVSLPWWLAKLQGRVLGLLPNPLLTADQVEMLKRDNVVSAEARGEGRTLEGIGIAPQATEAVLPTYLWQYRAAGQFTRTTMA